MLYLEVAKWDTRPFAGFYRAGPKRPEINMGCKIGAQAQPYAGCGLIRVARHFFPKKCIFSYKKNIINT